MTLRLIRAMTLLLSLLTTPVRAQDYPPYPDSFGGGTLLASGPRKDVYAFAGPGSGFGPGWFGAGRWPGGFPYGPRVAPPWQYPGLPGGPFVGYTAGLTGVYSGRAGSIWSNGLSLYGPPVPTYGPIPGMIGNHDLRRLWQEVPSPGIPFGWFGIFAASPRPRNPSVTVWPVAVEPVGAAGRPGAPRAEPNRPGGCLILSVKVPQPTAEVYVDGVKTMQTGTERLFESPVLAAGQRFRYEVTVRWTERGLVHERRAIATGEPGEVVRLDFTSPQLLATSAR